MKQFLKNAKAITILILMLSLIGCDTDDDNLPEVIAGFTHTINVDTGTVTFINTSVNSKNYFWTFGDGTSSTEINPIKTYTTGEYKVTLKATNVAGASDTSEDIIVISDAGAPVITLLGEPTINIEVGGTFTDPGATAEDDVDGDISADIVVGGDTVDVNTAGTYIITYNVSDAAGNTATQRTRTVIVAAGVTCTEETTQSLDVADFNLTFQTDPTASITDDGAVMISVANPDSDNTVNSSCQVGKVTRNPDFQYANNQINFDTPLDFNDNAGFKMKVWTPAVGTTVTVKLEGTGATEVQATTTKANEWEELTFDFASSESGKYTKIVLFFNINSNTPGEFYIDDFMLYGTGGGTACTDTTLVLPIDFDCEGIDYASKIVGNVSFSIIDNPELSGINNVASKVGSIVNVGENWENAFFNLDTPIDFSANNTIKFKFYSTVSVDLKLKMEDGTADPVEVDVNHGGTGWEELSFTFTNTDSYNDMIIFVDGPGTTAGTFYLDDIEQVAGGNGGGGGECPAPPAGELLSNGDFEAGESCWQFFAGSSLSTTVNNGGSNSAEIQGTTGAAVGLKQERFAAGVLLPNTSYTVSFDIIASGPFGEGGVFKTFAYSESAEGSNLGAIQHILADGVTSLSTSWERKTYTFTSSANPDFVAGGLSFLIEIVNSSVKLNVDNVVIKLAP